MLTLRQALYQKNDSGVPLPTVWTSLERNGIKFMRGQLVLVCAAPGIGKSAFVLTQALKSGVPTFYFSADSDEFIQTTRSMSILQGWTMDKSIYVYEKNKDEGAPVVSNTEVQFDFNPSPTLDEIESAIASTLETMDDFPHMIVVDNITDVLSGFAGNEDDPFAGLEPLMGYLHGMARKTGACVVGLHHVTGEYNDGTKPIPLKGVKNQIGRVPEMILTLHRIPSDHGPDTLNVSAVKNRSGRGFPSGRSYVSLQFDGKTMDITDFQ
ncbi:AAA family ATPase [Mycobacteroides abscessus]|uniref:AAA family ATPase n=1 Tax=Mycobacteroides abscessus TaxID=36809 RepID=UPI0009A6895C|nr:AAA family ATPase [Mycobacteroides abscessus]SKR72853.1 Replicative DNA helicase [Mycobacteroides abscessus subsp. massiliense]